MDQSEREFQSAVIDYARLNGWKIAHFHDSRRQVGDKLVGDKDAAGFPDLVLVRDETLIFAELKTEKGRLSATQVEWLDALAAVAVATGQRVCRRIWRPRDWTSIEAELRRSSVERRAA